MEPATLVPLPDDVELPHQRSEGPHWQESIILGWVDPSQQIGGFIRIGHRPNLGLTRSCFGVTSRNRLNYTRTAQDLALRPGDRTTDTFRVDDFQSATSIWYRWARAGRDLAVADAALDYLMANKPGRADVSVLWGDPTPANTMFLPDGTVSAILDFEMAALGPGEADLAWWVGAEDNFSTLSGVPRLEGLPTRAEIIAHYEAERGRKIADLDYYLMLAWFRMNIVGIRFSDHLVGEGRLPAETDVLTRNPAAMLMAQRLGLPDSSPGEGFMAMIGGMAGAS